MSNENVKDLPSWKAKTRRLPSHRHGSPCTCSFAARALAEVRSAAVLEAAPEALVFAYVDPPQSLQVPADGSVTERGADIACRWFCPLRQYIKSMI